MVQLCEIGNLGNMMSPRGSTGVLGTGCNGTSYITNVFHIFLARILNINNNHFIPHLVRGREWLPMLNLHFCPNLEPIGIRLSFQLARERKVPLLPQFRLPYISSFNHVQRLALTLRYLPIEPIVSTSISVAMSCLTR